MAARRPPSLSSGIKAQWLAHGVEKFPDSPSAPEALYEFGWALQNLGKLDEAVARYEQVVAKTDREAAARASS